MCLDAGRANGVAVHGAPQPLNGSSACGMGQSIWTECVFVSRRILNVSEKNLPVGRIINEYLCAQDCVAVWLGSVLCCVCGGDGDGDGGGGGDGDHDFGTCVAEGRRHLMHSNRCRTMGKSLCKLWHKYRKSNEEVEMKMT